MSGSTSRSASSRSARTTALLGVVLPLVLTAAPALAAEGPAATQTYSRISAPAKATPGRSADIWVRLLSGHGAVPNAEVILQRQTSGGWAQVGHLTTRSGGLGHALVPFSSTGRYRAYYRGDAVRTSSLSRQVVVTAASTLGQRAVSEASRHQGAPYSWGAAGPDRFDCSGFTMYVFGRLGYRLPHNASEQQQVTRHIAPADMQPGDLIFTYYNGSIGHVGIYAGNNQMWAAPRAGDHVRLQSLYSRNIAVGRVG